MSEFSSALQNQRIRISEPGDLIAAVPALLGFVPQASAVLICFDGTTVRHVAQVVRHDLPPGLRDRTGGRCLTEKTAQRLTSLCAAFTSVCANQSTPTASVVIIDADAVPGNHRLVAQELSDALESVGTRLLDAFATAAVEPGQRWWSLGSRARAGQVSDPATSPVTCAHVLQGRSVLPSRAAMLRQLEPGDDAERAEIRRACKSISGSRNAAQQPGLRAAVALVLALAGARSRPKPVQVARLGQLLLDREIRDCLFGFAIGPLEHQVEQLWRELLTLLPLRLRVVPAVLFAYSAYLRGDGALAGEALHVALEIDPDYKMANLMITALHGGMHPDLLRELGETGIRLAAEQGVVLPSWSADGQG